MAGAYFVTICTQNRACLFGNIRDGLMMLNEYGEIARDEWTGLAARFHTVIFDVFQIMPNHIHGIIRIVGATTARGAPNAIMPTNVIANVGATLAVAQRAGASPAPTTTITVGDIVGAYKSLAYKRCLDLCKPKNVMLGRLWQRNYYEHIIRNNEDYDRIAAYIVNNPQKWEEDELWAE